MNMDNKSGGVFPITPKPASRVSMFFAKVFGKKITSSDFSNGLVTKVTSYHWRGKMYVTDVTRIKNGAIEE